MEHSLPESPGLSRCVDGQEEICYKMSGTVFRHLSRALSPSSCR
jgi:hypothetical protein